MKKLENAINIVKEAKIVINREFTVSEKSPKDLVTDIDIAVEKHIFNELKRLYPNDYCYGEESGGVLTDMGNVWVLDPIDGTGNFVYQNNNFAISLAYIENGITQFGIVLDVRRDDLYTAIINKGAFVNGKKIDKIKEVKLGDTLVSFSHKMFWLQGKLFQKRVKGCFNYRYYGVASLEMIWCATNFINMYIGKDLKPWDYLAAKLFVEESGGFIRTFDNNIVGLDYIGPLVVGNKTNVKEFLGIK